MSKSDFEERRLRRISNMKRRANQKDSEAQALHSQASQMADGIPFGQPILVGHHSEQRDRNYRGRIHDKFGKAFQLQDEAKSLRSRAEAAERNNAIFSDDPNAIEKLDAKIARLTERQELMKAANKLVRKEDREGLADLGFSEAVIAKLLEGDWLGRKGFPSYEITNNGANIRRLKERLTYIEKHAEDENTEKELPGGCRIVDNAEENRVQVFFPGKPAEAVRGELKQNGFRWAPTFGVWQRNRSAWALQLAEQIVKKYYS